MTQVVGGAAGVRLADLTWDEVPVSPLVLLPLGSTEQHGPHLPLRTDTTIAVHVAMRAAEQLGSAAHGVPAVVAPPLEYGASGEHQDFRGTVSTGAPALRFLLSEMFRSLSRWASRVVVVNGHGGNVQGLVAAVLQMVEEGHEVTWVPCRVQGADAHAGHIETSLMQHLCPELVRMDKAVVGNTTPLWELMPALRDGGVASVSPSGVLGDPTGATAEQGAEALAQMIQDVVVRILHGEADGTGCLQVP